MHYPLLQARNAREDATCDALFRAEDASVFPEGSNGAPTQGVAKQVVIGFSPQSEKTDRGDRESLVKVDDLVFERAETYCCGVVNGVGTMTAFDTLDKRRIVVAFR